MQCCVCVVRTVTRTENDRNDKEKLFFARCVICVRCVLFLFSQCCLVLSVKPTTYDQTGVKSVRCFVPFLSIFFFLFRFRSIKSVLFVEMGWEEGVVWCGVGRVGVCVCVGCSQGYFPPLLVGGQIKCYICICTKPSDERCSLPIIISQRCCFFVFGVD